MTYKNEYTRLFPSKISSTSFLTVYTLYLLKNKSMYGKEILDHIIVHLGSDVWSPSHGTLYPLLQKMCVEGLIVHTEDYENKKLYAITSVGLQSLTEQIEILVPILRSSHEFLGKVVKELYSARKQTKEV